MTRIKFSSASGKSNFDSTISTLVFAGILIVCSVAVGCSSEKPATPIAINPQPAQAAPQPAMTPASATAPVAETPVKPVHKKVVRKAPPTVMYANEGSGISFEYPRKFALKTGEAADKLVSSDKVPMNFVQPGGVALAAVAVPETAYPKSDLAAAFFNVSVNKGMTEEQCGEFSVPEKKGETSSEGTAKVESKTPKVMIGEMELQSAETVANDGTREEDSKYYHAFENGRAMNSR